MGRLSCPCKERQVPSARRVYKSPDAITDENHPKERARLRRSLVECAYEIELGRIKRDSFCEMECSKCKTRSHVVKASGTGKLYRCCTNRTWRNKRMSKQRKVYKFRMEPTVLQSDELLRMAGTARFIWNWALFRCQTFYKEN